MTPSFLDAIAKLPEAIREAVEERAAITEFLGNLPRAEAEQAALKALNKP
jgi:hypothetical protein